MKINKLIIALICCTLIFTSCANDDNLNLPDNEDPTGEEQPMDADEPLGAFEGGLLVSNEGPFNTGVGSVSFSRRRNRTRATKYLPKC